LSADALGSIVATNDPAGAVSHSVVFDAWGNTKSEVGVRQHPFTYTGRETGEAGALYYRARQYWPAIGRFFEEDPLGSPGWVAAVGLQGRFVRPGKVVPAYEYVSNSPTFYGDPSGLRKCASGKCPDCPSGVWTQVEYATDVTAGFLGFTLSTTIYECVGAGTRCTAWTKCIRAGLESALEVGVTPGFTFGKDCVCGEDLGGPDGGFEVGATMLIGLNFSYTVDADTVKCHGFVGGPSGGPGWKFGLVALGCKTEVLFCE
ncbi:MAG: hypothetical protein IT186_14315, partial [Acidobacteria bacterium]|nr:hypothetical protein [Acidobacteriota bacterium]